MTNLDYLTMALHDGIDDGGAAMESAAAYHIACPYYTRRECISFNKDGFIGFAGWADDGNSNPIRRAFLEWCDILKQEKEGREQ